jgi:hypothetical protein
MSDLSNDFRKSAIFRKLVEDIPAMQNDVTSFNSEYGRFISSDVSTHGVVLRCHLIVEHFLDEYLAAANPAIQNWDSARLSFAQKLALADHKLTVLHLIMPALKCLNAVRNTLSHDLRAEVDEGALSPIRSFMTAWNTAARKPIPAGVRLLEEFAMFASAVMHGDVRMIQRHSPKSGLIGLLDWYHEGDGHK